MVSLKKEAQWDFVARKYLKIFIAKRPLFNIHQMRRTNASRKPVRKSVSPLLASLVQAGDSSIANSLMLRSWIALDALHRGAATANQLTLLAQQLLISEELCLSGYQKSRLQSVRKAHAALVQLDWNTQPNSDCKAPAIEYEALREALVVYDAQLRSAPRAQVRAAESMTISRLLDHKAKGEQV
ncbi:hypothetical protein [Caballeronia temeraria]|uniref:hypothetical protein n=1 Tax=Caballeronia temeraria TaxID=1777137 RepID=UPI0012FD090B|nr:hypothetical protein [Caballeronia temeraria]